MNRRAMVQFASALLVGGLLTAGPVLAQAAYPPVPGPFLVAPTGVGMAPGAIPDPTANAATYPPSHPLFSRPANAMRVPYWMQQAPSAPVAAAPSGDGAPQAAPTGYGQTTAPGSYPSPTQQAASGAGGYRAPVAAQPVRPGWGYPIAPFWGRAPYTPQAGWGAAPGRSPYYGGGN